MAVPSTVDDFVALVHKSDLLDARQFRSYLDDLARSSDQPRTPDRFAKALVRDGFLTFYQAEQLLAGCWRNFYVGGKYKVLERLGEGGMASVFLCEHKVMRRLVALKVLPSVGADDPETLARFHREARAAAQLNHPNVVHAHDVDKQGKFHFLVMEYVDGTNLEDYVGRHGPMDHVQAAHYIQQAAVGLQHAHEAGLIHRDIKPSNLLVDTTGTVKLLDLGLARFSNDGDGLTKRAESHLILGTMEFLAPEQAVDSHGVDIRADIYSLGATFYFLLTGRTLFPEGSLAERMYRLQMQRHQPIRERCPGVPKALAAVLDRMLEKDPAARYQTPDEVIEALAPWTRKPIPPPPASDLSHLSPVARSSIQRQSSLKMAMPAASGTGSNPRLPAPKAAASPASSRARARIPVARWMIGAAVAASALLLVEAYRYWRPAPAPAAAQTASFDLFTIIETRPAGSAATTAARHPASP